MQNLRTLSSYHPSDLQSKRALAANSRTDAKGQALTASKVPDEVIDSKRESLAKKKITLEQSSSIGQYFNDTCKKPMPAKCRNSSKVQAQSQPVFKESKEGKKFSLADFQELRVVGKGSFGTVKLVKRDDSYFALKCLSKNEIKGQKRIEHVLNERDILQKLVQNPFCCRMLETLQDDQHLYILLEYLPGGELLKLIRKQGVVSEKDTQFYIAEVILAVESLHDQGIIYRDLKPENILIDRDGHVKLIDFGFAKQLQDINQRTYTNCGTPGYCAPEVMMGSIGHTYKADIWSVGILICEMIGGFVPFKQGMEASNPKTIMEKIRSGNLNLPRNLNTVARDLVKKLLADDPLQRLEISEIKAHKFFQGINWKKLQSKQVRPPYVP